LVTTKKGTHFLLQRTIIQLKNHYFWIHHIPKEPCWQHSFYGIWIVFSPSYATFSLQWVPFFVVTQYLVALVYKNMYNEMLIHTTTTTNIKPFLSLSIFSLYILILNFYFRKIMYPLIDILLDIKHNFHYFWLNICWKT